MTRIAGLRVRNSSFRRSKNIESPDRVQVGPPDQREHCDTLGFVKAGAGVSTLPASRAAAIEAAMAARAGLGARPAELAFVFASVHHREGARDVLAGVWEAVNPRHAIG